MIKLYLEITDQTGVNRIEISETPNNEICIEKGSLWGGERVVITEPVYADSVEFFEIIKKIYLEKQGEMR